MTDITPLLRERFDIFAIKVALELNPSAGFRATKAFAAMTYSLGLFASADAMRLIINVPPRSGKSICASVALPCFLLGRDPSLSIICVSYSIELAAQFSRQARDVMQSAWYRQLFPATVLGGKVTETELQTTRYGGRLATSVGGTLTGRGGDVIIIDDPMKGGDAASESARRSLETWYSETLVSRADNKKNNRELIVMQRLHVDDLSGILLERGGYQHLCLPAIAGEPKIIPIGPNGATWYRPTGDLIDPENEPLGVYKSLKLSMGTKAFSAQYLQDPLPEENGVLKWEWFRTYTELPRASPGLMRWHASWDLAVQPGEGHDWSVGIIAVEIQSKLYIKNVIRVREALPYVIKRIRDVRREHPGVTTYIEAGGNGPAAIQQLRHSGMPNVQSVTPRYSKEVRLSTISPQIERGMVHLPANASWLPDFKKEMLAFPRSTYDDQVDALSQLVQEVLTPRGRTGIMEMRA